MLSMLDFSDFLPVIVIKTIFFLFSTFTSVYINYYMVQQESIHVTLNLLRYQCLFFNIIFNFTHKLAISLTFALQWMASRTNTKYY
uniref:Putative ovule protein n=1 Tax=Solanum chacoense TaxID=4108 RepID=A0A0V0I1X9_SOLCH